MHSDHVLSSREGQPPDHRGETPITPSVRKLSFGIAQLSEHQPDRGELDERESFTG